MSDWLMPLPLATGQSRIRKYSGDTPLMLVAQFWSSLTSEALLRSWGEA